MGELTPKDRLQPSLLNRLTDDKPDLARRGPGSARPVAGEAARVEVRRNIAFLPQRHAPRGGP